MMNRRRFLSGISALFFGRAVPAAPVALAPLVCDWERGIAMSAVVFGDTVMHIDGPESLFDAAYKICNPPIIVDANMGRIVDLLCTSNPILADMLKHEEILASRLPDGVNFLRP